MQFAILKSRIAALGLVAMSLTATGCGGPDNRPATFPPAPLVKVEDQPVPGPEVFESEGAADLYESAYTAWAERGWSRVAEICRDAVRKGAPYVANWCPPAPE